MLESSCTRRWADQFLINAPIGQVKSEQNHLSGNATNQDLGVLVEDVRLSVFCAFLHQGKEHREFRLDLYRISIDLYRLEPPFLHAIDSGLLEFWWS